MDWIKTLDIYEREKMNCGKLEKIGSFFFILRKTFKVSFGTNLSKAFLPLQKLNSNIQGYFIKGYFPDKNSI